MKRRTLYRLEFTLRIAIVAITLGCVGILLTVLAGCDQFKSVGNAGKALVVDCTKAEIVKVTHELGPLVDELLMESVDGEGGVNWDPVKEAATRWSADLGGCLIAEAIARALAPPSEKPDAPQLSPITVDKAELRQGWEQFRALKFGGVRFKTKAGTL